ncbi:Swt1 family HEPN domain-containing protein [Nocardia sp. NPDC052278]|uniref:Swt1 family HEPN domain-containing protein n=1 Tax=unclassified Nocardia TaxID=2637762 RepID=UPI0036745F76
MAISNRERVGRGLEQLAKGLEPFVDMWMGMAMPGKDWLAALEARDNQKGGANRTYSKSDSRFLLRVITEEWRVFKDRLTRVESSYASELRDVGNKWGHNEPFPWDDTYRALDTMERLLQAVGAVDEADVVRKLRQEHQRSQYDQETKKAASSISLPQVGSDGIKPWREIVTPHPDVAGGQMEAAEFAADLYTVSIGESTSPEYADPVQFFRRTFLTEGLQDLLKKAVARVSGDMNATPVWNLQTNFGGGKTHSMLALWHLFSGTNLAAFPQEVADLLAGQDTTIIGAKVKRAALVGNHFSARTGKTHDGIHVNTVWGELAWQLGGAEGYRLIQEADESGTNPADAFRQVLSDNAPCLILIDEWVAYARELYGRDDLPGGTFDTQFTFAQTLTEYAKTTPGALLVVSIPASSEKEAEDGIMGSAMEVGAANGLAALDRLQRVIRRVASQWLPARPHEAFEIVRRRLFEEPDAQAKAEIGAVAKAFWKFYNNHKGEFPPEFSEVAYEKRIAVAYPIHPELFDRLYEDWSTLDRFQRTRGVLRLMSMVIHKLWHSPDASPLIMPGSVPLDDQAIVSELSQYLEDNWKAIISVDVDGVDATPMAIDKERSIFGKRQLTRRLARTVFFGATPTLKHSHQGIERQYIWAGVAIPGDQPGNFGSALQQLSERSTYLYADGARFWYDTHPSVGRTAKDYAERLEVEDVWLELEKRLKAKEQKSTGTGDFAEVRVTDSSSEVADDGYARLVIVHPSHWHAKNDQGSSALTFARNVLETKGTKQRINRNMLVFLAADSKRLDELQHAVRDYLAWCHIADRKEELGLSLQQSRQVDARLGSANQAVELRILETYIWALVPDWKRVSGQVAGGSLDWQIEKADGAKPRLAERVSAKLNNIGALTTVLGAPNIRRNLDNELATTWQDGHVRVGDLWSYYCRYPYLQRVRDRVVFDDAIRVGLDELDWEKTGFALADGHDGTEYQGLALGGSHATFGQITDDTLVVRPDVAIAQWQAEQERKAQEEAKKAAAAGAAGSTGSAGGTVAANGGATLSAGQLPGGETERAAPKNVRYFGSASLDPETYQRSFNRLAENIIAHLASVDGAELEIAVEISARAKDGFPEHKVRTVSENSRTLKLDTFGFENQ